MELKWKHDPGGSYYELWLLDDKGESLPGSYTWLRDFTAEPAWKRRTPQVPGYITFQWGNCHGNPVQNMIHTAEDGFTLEQTMHEAENWLLNHFIGEHLLATAKANMLAPIAAWAKEYLDKERKASC